MLVAAGRAAIDGGPASTAARVMRNAIERSRQARNTKGRSVFMSTASCIRVSVALEAGVVMIWQVSTSLRYGQRGTFGRLQGSSDMHAAGLGVPQDPEHSDYAFLLESVKWRAGDRYSFPARIVSDHAGRGGKTIIDRLAAVGVGQRSGHLRE